MSLIFFFLMMGAVSFAQNLPGTSWALNPKYKFQEKAGAAKFSGANGFNSTYVSGVLELQLKATKIEDPKLAHQMCSVEFGNLEKLYSARGNPYEGQITEVIECDTSYKPRLFDLKIGGQERKGLLVGANERRLFGACVKGQVAFWVSYFNFYDAPSKMVVESRLFLKSAHPDRRTVGELSKKLEKISRDLLVAKSKG